MPRLPDVQSLGARQTPGAPRQLSLESPEATQNAVQGQVLADVGGQMTEAADRIFRREDTLARTSARTQFIQEAQEEYQARLTAGGFRTREDVASFRESIDGKIAQISAGVRMSGDSQAMLQQQLQNDRLSLIGQASSDSIIAQRAEVKSGISTVTRPVVASVVENPSNMTQAFRDVDSILSEYADALAPEEEIEERARLYSEIASSAVEGMLIAGDVDSALEVLHTPGVVESLPAERQRAYAQQITRLQRDEENRKMERQRRLEDAAFALNTSVEQLPMWARVQAAGLTLPPAQGGMEAQSPVGKIILDRQLFVSQYGADSPQVAAFDQMTQTEVAPRDLTTESGIRKEFTGQSKDFVTMRDAYLKVEAAGEEPSAASDQALVFAYMKILDPGSVVRETEFANAQNATGVPGQVRNVWNRLRNGEILNPEQRADFIKQSRSLMEAQTRSQAELETEYRRLAQDAGIKPDSVVVDFMGELRRWARPRAGQSDSGDGASKDDGGGNVIEYDLQGRRVNGGGDAGN